MTADFLYSASLLMSFACGTLGLVAALARLVVRRPGERSRVVVGASVLACVFAVVSFVVHLGWGHPPGTSRALPPMGFVREHLSFLVALLLPGIALVLRTASFSSRDNFTRRL